MSTQQQDPPSSTAAPKLRGKGIEAITFDSLDLIEIPVILDGKTYTLREATGGAAVKYRNAMIESTKLGPDGKPVSVRGIASTEPLLVSLCLFDEKDKRVNIEVIQRWPARVQKELYERVRSISELGEEEDDIADLEDQRDDIERRIAEVQRRGGSAKNGPSGMEDG